MHVYKNFQNHVTSLPKGYANDRVNNICLLVFAPLIIPIALFLAVAIGAIGVRLFELIFK